MNLRERTYLLFLAIPRIFIGYHFLNAAWPKVTGKFTNGPALTDLLGTSAKDPFAWHQHFIQAFVVPHIHFFSYLVAYGELAIGLSLLTGCLVRISASFAALENLNIYFAVAAGTQVGLNRIFIVLEVMFVLASAGRTLGLDGILKRKFPKSPLF
jgi:thiosulfate dehydrogenase [quinone] large subunit